MILDQLIDSGSQLSYKSYSVIGMTMAFLTAAASDNIFSIVVAFFIGASSAFGAAVIKWGIDKIKKRNNKKDVEPFDYDETYYN